MDVAENVKSLTVGKLVRRYKRFLADIELEDGSVVTAHVPNTGSMLSTRDPGSLVAISHQPSEKRKLHWTLELIQSENTWVGVNTSYSNRIVESAIEEGLIEELAGYDSLKREVKYGTSSRVDLLLTSASQNCYVEVKNVTYRNGDGAYFPDAVTSRGTKHLRELSEMIKAGHRAVLFFLVNRNDCHFVSPAADIDPVYADALRTASECGVEILAYGVAHTLQNWHLTGKIPVLLPSPA